MDPMIMRTGNNSGNNCTTASCARDSRTGGGGDGDMGRTGDGDGETDIVAFTVDGDGDTEDTIGDIADFVGCVELLALMF